MHDESRPGSGFHSTLEVWGRRKTLGILVFALVLAGSLSLVSSLPSIYRSTATVLVDRRDVAEAFARGAVTGELETRLETISQEVLSRSRLEELIKRFDLYPEMRKRGPAEAAIDQMRRDIRREVKATEPSSGSRSATISFSLGYRGREPETVARVTNALASLYVEENMRLRERQATGTAQFLRSQLGELKQKLEEQERRIGEQPQTVETEIAALERLNTRMRINSDRQLRLLDRRERMIKGEPLDAGGPVTAGSSAESVAARLARLKHELGELKTRFSDKYPDVIRVRSEIAALERRIAEEPPEPATDKKSGRAADTAPVARPAGKDPIKELDAELRQLKDEEATVRQTIAIYEKRVEASPRRQQEFQRQGRDYAGLKEQYQSLLKRYEDAQMAESMEQGQRSEQFRILDPALAEKDPIAPSRGRLALVGLALSLAMAAIAVVLAERFDTSFHSVNDLRALSKVPVLADIPRLVTEGDGQRLRRRQWLAATGLLVVFALVIGTSHVMASGNESLSRLLSMTTTATNTR